MKNLIFTLICFMGVVVQLQGQQLPSNYSRNGASIIAPSQIVRLNPAAPGGNRAINSFEVSYAEMDANYAAANSFDFGYFVWNLNYNARINTNPYNDSGNDFIRWGAVLFDSINNYKTGAAYNLASTTNMTLDSIYILFRHTNVSGFNDTLVITVYEAANTASGYTFAAGSNGLAVTNTVLYRDTIITNTSLTPNTTPTALYQVPIEVVGPGGNPVNIPQGKGYIVQLRYYGPLADLFELTDGNRLECGQVANTAASLSVVPGNTSRYYNLVFPPDPPDPADSSLTGIMPLSFPAPFPTNCNQYYFQNLGISTVITFDDGAPTACPDAPTGNPGFRPNYNSLACINQSTAYTSNVSFEVPTAITQPIPATINSIRIDSIRNLPCGISYTLDRVNATYNGGQVGCITFTGTTTSPVGAYRLQVFATINSSAGTFPSSDISNSGFEYYLRVIANGTTTCATVVSGTTGLTANCTTTPPLTASPSANPITICRGAATTLNANASGGTAPYTYAWSASGGATAPTAVATPTVSPTVTTTYTVTVTATGGATATGSVIVNVTVPSATITPGGATTFCQGGSVVLSAPAGHTYQWTGGTTNRTLTVTTGGTYSVTTTLSGCTATSSVTVTVNNAPSATISGNTTFCSGGSTTLSAPAGLTYLWSQGNATSQTINVTTAGTYSVTTTQNGCTATSSVNVTIGGPNATITPSGPTTFCTGGSVVLSAPAGLTYTWSSNAGSSTNQAVTVTQTGTYSVTVSNGSCTATSNVAVSVVSSPSATITANGPTTFCAGGDVILSAPAGYDYVWSNNAGGATTRTVTVTQSGTYNVTVSAGASCTATSSISVTVNALPTVTISASGPTSFCTGGSVTLTASNGTSYLWSNGSTQSSITTSQPGTYTVTVTSANTCSNTASQIVSVVSTPSAVITPSGSTTICPGSSVTLSAPSGFTYSWSNSATTESITATLPGTYSVTVSAGGSCTATSSVTVSQHAAPTATVTPAGPVTICNGSTVTLSAPAGLQYAWSNGSTTQTISPTLAGTYSVVVTNANNCSATSNSVVVTAANPPTKPVITNNNNVLSSTAAASYEWQLNGSSISGATSQSFTPAVSGSYTVIITDANGCSNVSDAVVVTIVGIANVNNDLTIKVSPNPSNGMFYITTGGYSGTFTVTVLDLAGREVKTEIVNGQLQQHPLDMSLVGDGVYILRLSTGDAVNYTRLIVY